MLNTTWLRTFCTLVEIGHFTRTAETLHMTQSGVSQHVQKLEAQLGRTLLTREKKQFRLTEAGQRLYDEANRLLAEFSNLANIVTSDPAFEGLVKIMSPGSVGLKLYPYLLSLQKEHPKLVMNYRFAPNADIESAIVESSVDIGIMSSKPSLPDVNCEAIGSESLLLVTPAHVETPSWDSLKTLGFIDHPDGSHHADLLLSSNYPEFQHSNLFIQRGFSNQISLILTPVSMGLGFTILPAYAVDAFPKSDKIKSHHLNHPVSETLYLCTRRNTQPPNRIKTVIADIKQRI
ncbi:LysR family transcriptional regulator [Idiomarina abyssalis]|uniref:LysR family transcriptional regulator n=1 Tax=Idiomarina abyssalis TaxID=86102 RepID=UPI003A9573CF